MSPSPYGEGRKRNIFVNKRTSVYLLDLTDLFALLQPRVSGLFFEVLRIGGLS